MHQQKSAREPKFADAFYASEPIRLDLGVSPEPL